MKIPIHFGLTSFSGPKALFQKPFSDAFDAFSAKPNAECSVGVKNDSIALRVQGVAVDEPTAIEAEESTVVADVLSRLMKLPTRLAGLEISSDTISQQKLISLKNLALNA